MVKAFALVFVLTLDKQNAINFQLLGGIWILQTLPSIVFGLYTRWFHRWALLAGWAVGMVYGTVTAYNVISPTGQGHFGGSLATIPLSGKMGYIALTAFVINVIVAAVAHADPAGPEGRPGGGRRDRQPRLLRRRGRPPGQAAAGADDQPALTSAPGRRSPARTRAGRSVSRTCPPSAFRRRYGAGRRTFTRGAAAARSDPSTGAAQHPGEGVDDPGSYS